MGIAPSAFGKRPHQLSGGMARRVALAAGIATGADVVLLDEPTSGLDALVAADVQALLLRIALERELGILVATHDRRLIRDFCSRVIVLRGGRVVAEGEVRELAAGHADPYVRELLPEVLS